MKTWRCNGQLERGARRPVGTAHGQRLLEAHVRPTREVVLTKSPATLKRRSDPATGLTLIDIDES